MRASAKASIAALVGVSALVAACNKAPPGTSSSESGASSSPAVATVNGVPVTRAEFDLYVKNLLRNARQQTTLTPEQQGQVLDELIGLQLLSAQGDKDGLQDDPDVKAQLALLHMRVLADAESQKYIKANSPSEADLKAEYEQAISTMDHTEYHARHILVASKDQAEQVIKKLKAGAKFEDLAKSQSTDTGSKNNGGDLGWFTPARMVPAFANAVKTLKKGDISDPVQTQYGWHVIQLVDTRDAQPPAFENPQVQERLKEGLERKKLLDYVAELKKTAKIERKLDVAAAPASGTTAPASGAAPASPSAPASAASSPSSAN
jgi:peptidyl-prolyl cis-trans isomerase C